MMQHRQSTRRAHAATAHEVEDVAAAASRKMPGVQSWQVQCNCCVTGGRRPATSVRDMHDVQLLCCRSRSAHGMDDGCMAAGSTAYAGGSASSMACFQKLSSSTAGASQCGLQRRALTTHDWNPGSVNLRQQQECRQPASARETRECTLSWLYAGSGWLNASSGWTSQASTDINMNTPEDARAVAVDLQDQPLPANTTCSLTTPRFTAR